MNSQLNLFSEERKNYTAVQLTVDGEHAEVIIDTPGEKVNKLTKTAFLELQEHIGFLRAKSSQIRSVLFRSAKPDIFLAGADITEIRAMKTPTEARQMVDGAQEVFQELAELPQLTVVLIDGPCMGGGLELALACKIRLASDSPQTRIGLPEVQLGVLPGAGGTQRLPGVVGIATALEIMTTGAPFDSRKALKTGLIDDVIPKEYLLDFARNYVRGTARLRHSKKPHLWLDKLMGFGPARKLLLGQVRKKIISKTHGFYPAPLKILEVIDQTWGLEKRAGLKIEAQAFVDLAMTPEAKNLIHLFFANEELKKERGVSSVEASQFQPQKFFQMGVVGAGIMGGGIAAVAAQRGISVRLKDIQHDSLLKGMKTADSLFSKDFKRKKITKAEYKKRLYAVSPTLSFLGFQHLPVIVEAVVERMDIKKKLIEELEQTVSDKTIIASNTSSLSVSEMALGAKHPERIVGMHFFNPVPKMPLVEVVRADKTSPEVVVQTVSFAKQLGKTVIVVKDRPGFLVNRVLMPYLIESSHLLKEGYSVEQVDRAATAFGMPMGPFRLLDEVGLDTAAKVAHVIASAFPHMVVLPLIDDLVASGHFGRKNSKGFYIYDSAGKEVSIRQEFKTESKADNEETNLMIQDRLILPMVNEAVKALDEGIVATVRDLDMGLIFGIGFPAFYGGLLKWVSQVGEQKIVDRMYKNQQATQGRLAVPDSLIQRARNGNAFYSSL